MTDGQRPPPDGRHAAEEAVAEHAHTRRRALRGAAATVGGAVLVDLVGAAPALASTPLTFNVQDPPYNAKGDGVTDDASAIQAAITAASSLGGKVVFPAGTYIVGTTLTLPSDVMLLGGGVDATVLKLKASANTTLIKTTNYDALVGTQPSSAPHSWRLQDLVLDGNKGANSSGDGLRTVSYGYTMENVIIRNFKGLGLYSELNGDADSVSNNDAMEAWLSQVKVHGCNGGGVVWNGPHDSMWSNVVVYLCGPDGVETGSTTSGVDVRTYGSPLQITNCHVWGRNQKYALKAGATVYALNTQLEGAESAQMWVMANECQFIGGRIFSARTNNQGTGIQIGDGTTYVNGTFVSSTIDVCALGALNFASDGGTGRYIIQSYQPSGPFIVGTPAENIIYRNRFDLHVVGDTGIRTGDDHIVTAVSGFSSGWSNYGSGYEVAGYYRDAQDRVHLRGAIKSGTAGGSTVFTLPSGLRPANRLPFIVQSSTGTGSGRVDVRSDGTVTVESVGSNALLSLNGISFLADGG